MILSFVQYELLNFKTLAGIYEHPIFICNHNPTKIAYCSEVSNRTIDLKCFNLLNKTISSSVCN